ncbi:unnamed protein product [Oppiella nova]|uniref:Uncharacterized protein n=1 Tax=Oppiella nova TaxID=334625 RepID=A0A7R9LVU2_9ACAR|nr:unnamed protein product [Oppiella nova]CAG2167445.1 unnamed protein product [Oppiella nova]
MFKVISILAMIVLLFAICWLPIHVNLYSVLNKYFSQLKCRRSDYLQDESESHTRSQFVTLYSTKYKKRTTTTTTKSDKNFDDKTDV